MSTPAIAWTLPPPVRGSNEPCRSLAEIVPRLVVDLYERRELTLHVADTDLGGEPLGDGEVRVGERRGRVQGHRPARVRASANLGSERNLAEEGNPQALRRTARPAGAEYLVPRPAMRAHVLR